MGNCPTSFWQKRRRRRAVSAHRITVCPPIFRQLLTTLHLRYHKMFFQLSYDRCTRTFFSWKRRWILTRMLLQKVFDFFVKESSKRKGERTSTDITIYERIGGSANHERPMHNGQEGCYQYTTVYIIFFINLSKLLWLSKNCHQMHSLFVGSFSILSLKIL